MLKKFFFIIFIIFNINLIASTQISTTSEEEAEILKIQNEISQLQKKLEQLQNQKKLKQSVNRPKIGLVLSGGGAKGLAHIGVLRELEANNIPIDFIAGTSIGAIIGAFYSAGYSPDEIEQIISSSDLASFFDKNDTKREYLPFEKKTISKTNTMTIKYDNKFNFYLPKGLNTSNDVYFLLKRILKPVEGINDFNKLPIPLRVVATNLNTGEGTAFQSGDLARVITASAAIPTVFAPVEIDGVEYVDGMLAKNYPVTSALEMGADIIIGSDVGVTLNEDKHSYDIVSTFNQILALSSANSSKKEKEIATFNILPDVNYYSPSDFSQNKEIIKEGEVAAKLVIPNIKKSIALSENYTDKKSRPKIELDKIKDSDIKFNEIIFTKENLDIDTKNRIYSILKKDNEESISYNEFQSRLSTIQGFSYIDKIYYKIDEKSNTLTLDVIPSPSNNIGVSANYRSDYGTTFKLSTDLFFKGEVDSLTDLSVKFGDYYGVALSNFSYYGSTNKIGFFSSLSFEQSPLYIYHNNRRESKYISNDAKLDLGFSSLFYNKLALSYGVSFIRSSLDLETGSGDYSKIETTENYGNTFLKLNFDTLDNASVPTSGNRGEFKYTWGGSLNSDDNVDFYGPIYSGETHFKVNKKTSLYSSVTGGVVSGEEIPSTKYLKIGGIKNNLSRNEIAFAGYYYQNLLVDEAIVGELGFNYLIVKNLYLIGNYNIGTFGGVLEDDYSYQYEMWSHYIHGTSFGVTYLSLFGPLSLSISKNDSHESDVLIQFSIGYFLD